MIDYSGRMELADVEREGEAGLRGLIERFHLGMSLAKGLKLLG